MAGRAYSRFQKARAFKFAKRTSGDFTLNNTSWTELDSGLNLVLAAEVDDVIEVGASGQWGNAAVDAALDVASVVSGSAVNFWGAGGASDYGIQAWQGISGVYVAFGGTVLRTLVSGDLSSGAVTLSLRYRTASATNKTLQASSDQPLQWYAKNLGPVDPN